MTAQTRLITADDLWQMPNHGGRNELLQGELRPMSPTGKPHGEITFELGLLLGQHIKPRRLGKGYGAETGFFIARNPDTILAPDLAFVRAERLIGLEDVTGYVPLVPDLVAEVTSPSDTQQEIAEKVALWLNAGVQAVLVVDPCRQTVAVHRPTAPSATLRIDATLDVADVVPGWTVPVRDIFSY